MRRREEQVVPFQHDVFALPLLRDAASLELFGEQILRAVNAPEILKRLNDEFFNGTAEYNNQVRNITKVRSEKNGQHVGLVANIDSIAWDYHDNVSDNVKRHSASIGVLNGEHLGFYIGLGDPQSEDYERNLWSSLRLSGKYSFSKESGNIESMQLLRPFIANQTIHLSSQGLADRQDFLYEEMAHEITVFYSE